MKTLSRGMECHDKYQALSHVVGAEIRGPLRISVEIVDPANVTVAAECNEETIPPAVRRQFTAVMGAPTLPVPRRRLTA